MDNILKVKSMSLWIFIVPFFAINACLILITQFHGLFPNPEHILHDTIPYIDGKASISRTARVFPTYLIFKPAMFLTSFLLIKYWLNNKKIILYKDPKNTYINKFVFFGIGSAVLLVIHSIFLVRVLIFSKINFFELSPLSSSLMLDIASTIIPINRLRTVNVVLAINGTKNNHAYGYIYITGLTIPIDQDSKVII
mgnify:CR=1 FL=1